MYTTATPPVENWWSSWGPPVPNACDRQLFRAVAQHQLFAGGELQAAFHTALMPHRRAPAGRAFMVFRGVHLLALFRQESEETIRNRPTREMAGDVEQSSTTSLDILVNTDHLAKKLTNCKIRTPSDSTTEASLLRRLQAGGIGPIVQMGRHIGQPGSPEQVVFLFTGW
jgi:hypothetical protein